MVSNTQCAGNIAALGYGPLTALCFSTSRQRQWVTREHLLTHLHPQQAQLSLILTLAGFPITSQAEARPAPAGPCLVAVGQQADVRAAPWLSILVVLTGVTPHWGQRRKLSAPFRALLRSPRGTEIFAVFPFQDFEATELVSSALPQLRHKGTWVMESQGYLWLEKPGLAGWGRCLEALLI